MTQEIELERLEAVVVKLLAKYDTLRAEKSDLEAELSAREQDIEDLQNELDSSNNQRGDMTTRVKGLLGQIEDWELSLDGEAEESEEDADEDDDEETDEEETESRVQHNLFSVDKRAEG